MKSIKGINQVPWGYSSVVKRGEKSGDILRWAVYGWYSTPLDDSKEPLRTFSPQGWRGSRKYPFGKAFSDPYSD